MIFWNFGNFENVIFPFGYFIFPVIFVLTFFKFVFSLQRVELPGIEERSFCIEGRYLKFSKCYFFNNGYALIISNTRSDFSRVQRCSFARSSFNSKFSIWF